MPPQLESAKMALSYGTGTLIADQLKFNFSTAQTVCSVLLLIIYYAAQLRQ